MATPKDAPYKLKQKLLNVRKSVFWRTDPTQDNFVTNDGKIYEQTANGLRIKGQLEVDALAAEHQRRKHEIEEFVKGVKE
jgi:hypothetical protein